MDRPTTPNQPQTTFRDGRLKATVWENTGESGPYHTVTLSKVYEDRDGKLQETHSFTGSELLRVAELAREAHAFTRDLRREMAVERQAERQAERPSDRPTERQSERGGDRTGASREHARSARPDRFANYPSPGR